MNSSESVSEIGEVLPKMSSGTKIEDPIGIGRVESKFPKNDPLNELNCEVFLLDVSRIGLYGVDSCFDSEIGLQRLRFAEPEEPCC